MKWKRGCSEVAERVIGRFWTVGGMSIECAVTFCIGPKIWKSGAKGHKCAVFDYAPTLDLSRHSPFHQPYQCIALLHSTIFWLHNSSLSTATWNRREILIWCRFLSMEFFRLILSSSSSLIGSIFLILGRFWTVRSTSIESAVNLVNVALNLGACDQKCENQASQGHLFVVFNYPPFSSNEIRSIWDMF